MNQRSHSHDSVLGSETRGLWRYYSVVLGIGVVLFLLVIPVAQGGQHGGASLLGTITDSSHDGVGELQVMLRSGTSLQVTSTDERGRFEFLELEPGSYTLEVTGTGYQEAYDPNVYIRRGRSTTIRMKVAEASSIRVIPGPSDQLFFAARPGSIVDHP